MRLLSNPIQAGISAFSELTNTFGRQEMQEAEKQNLAKRRELMDVEIAGAKQRQEQDRKNNEFLQYERDIFKQNRLKSDQVEELVGAQAQHEAGVPLNDKQRKALWAATGTASIWEGQPPEMWDDISKDLDTLHEGILKYFPQIEGKLKEGQGVFVTEEQAPDWFSALNRTFKKQIDRGKSNFQGAASKKISQLYFDPKTGTMTPMLRVENDAGEVYFAPMTFDRGTDPNAQVLQMPLQLFGATLDANRNLSKMVLAQRVALGDPKAKKEWEETQKSLQENDAYAAGHDAAEAAYKANPLITANEQYRIALQAYRKKVKELGVISNDKEAVSEFDKFYRQRTTEKPPVDVAEFEMTEGFTPSQRGTPEYKSRYEEFQNRKVGLKHPFEQEKTEETARHNRALEKKEEEKAAETKRHNQAVESKPKEGKFSIHPAEDGTLLRVDNQAGTSSPVLDSTTGKPVKGKRELSSTDLRLIEKKANDAAKSIEDDGDIPDAQKEDLKATVADMLTKDQNLTHIQAIDKAKKAAKIPKQADMPDPKKNKGRTLTDTDTKKKYKSDGTKWVEMREPE